MAPVDVVTLHSPQSPSTILTLNFETNPLSLSVSHADRQLLSAHFHGFPNSPPSISSSTSTQLSVNWQQSDQNNQTLPSLTIKAQASPNLFLFDATSSTQLELSVDLDHQQWFGLGHLMHQIWPLNRASLPLGPIYPFDNGPTGICPLIEPTLFSTSGALVQADDTSTCLHLGINTYDDEIILKQDPLPWGVGLDNFDRRILPELVDHEQTVQPSLRIQARHSYDHPAVDHPWFGQSRKESSSPTLVGLRFAIGASDNVQQACKLNLQSLVHTLPKTLPPPPIQLMRYPIWSTWARYKDAVTQNDVLEFAKDIVDRNLPRSVMGIDDRWSVKYGDLDFDKVKFPDPAAMVKQLHEMGFLVTLWVTPFGNIDSKAVTHPETREHYIKDSDGNVGQLKWWQPTVVSALDVTNDSATDWFVKGLKRMCDEYGIDGYKFDAGEPCFLPKQANLVSKMESPQDYTRYWIQKVASQFRVSEVRSGVRGCQNAAPMFRLFDKLSTWGMQNGLSSVLSALLTSSILGYPFCIPDYIAGNAYVDETPNSELMIRWAQMTAAMPAMQFSIPPWSLGEECEKLCQRALQWREKFFWKYIEECIDDAQKSYIPITRPMWWLEPDNKEACEIFDQFLVGDNVLVAPVIIQGQTQRNVFLPSGQWQRVVLESGLPTEDVFHGPTLLENVSANLSEMPTFLRTG